MYNDNYIIKNKLNIDYPIYIPLRLYIVNHSLFVHPNKYIDLYMATQRQPAPQTELSQIQHKKKYSNASSTNEKCYTTVFTLLILIHT